MDEAAQRELEGLLSARGLDLGQARDIYEKAGLVQSEWDGLPVKNHLPAAVGARFATRSQWKQEGFDVPACARPVKMHPSMAAKRLFDYFWEGEVAGDLDQTLDMRSIKWRDKRRRLEAALKQSTGSGGLDAAVDTPHG